jgi:hypothetical protein
MTPAVILQGTKERILLDKERILLDKESQLSEIKR